MKTRIAILAAALAVMGCGEPPAKSNNGSNNGANNGMNNGGSNNGGSNNGGSNNGGSNNGGSNNGGTNNTLCKIDEPEFHRPAAEDCDNEREPGVTPMFDGECAADSDCTDGDNGRCLEEPRSATPYCSYDGCFVDADCGVDSVCECGTVGTVQPNVCKPGNCTTDADCGDTGYCSPSQGDCGAYFGTIGYFCHTCEDECVTDADCGGDPYTTYCAFDPQRGHWACSDAQCVG